MDISEKVQRFFGRPMNNETLELWISERDFYRDHKDELSIDDEFLLLVAICSCAMDIGRSYLMLEYLERIDELAQQTSHQQHRVRVQMLKSAAAFYFANEDIQRIENERYFEILSTVSDERLKYIQYSNWVYERTVYFQKFGWSLEPVRTRILEDVKESVIREAMAEGFPSYCFLAANFARLFFDVGDTKNLAKWSALYFDYIELYREKYAGYIQATLLSYNALQQHDFEQYYAQTNRRFDELKKDGMIDTLQMIYAEVLRDAKRYELDAYAFSVLQQQIQDIESGLVNSSQEKYASYIFNKELADWHDMAYVDSLTGVYNRRYYEEKSKESVVGCAVIDIDYMKQLNDTYGHAYGDTAISLVASTLQSFSSTQIDVIRYGGDEFILLFYGMLDARVQAGVIYQTIHQMFPTYEGQTLTFTTSMGLARRQQEESFAHLFTRADQALYEAKKAGRHQYKIAD